MEYGSLTEAILAQLRLKRYMTVDDLSCAIGARVECVGGVLTRLRTETPTRQRIVRIVGHRYTQPGKQDRWRALFGIGSGPDAVRPRPKTSAEKQRIYKASQKMAAAAVVPA